MHRRPNTDAPEHVYKILDANDWRQACERGQYVGSEDDKRDGFIHLSAAHQLAGTAAKYFSGKRNLLLVVFAADDLGESLKWEVARGGDLFPHYYGDLPTGLARASHALALDDNLNPVLPEDL